MLPRAPLRAIRPSVSLIPTPHLRHGAIPITSHLTSWQVRSYASSKSKPPRPPPPQSSKSAASPPPPKSFGKVPKAPPPPSTKDKTWKATNAIRFSGAAPIAQGAKSPVEGVRPNEDSISRPSPLEKGSLETEPVAQKLDADSPVAGSVRDEAQQKIAASENTPSPPEQPTEPVQLPDLRQGIPSTFDMEFGAGKQQKATQDSQIDQLELSSAPPESARDNEQGEREYAKTAYETSIDRKRRQVVRYVYASAFLIAALTGFYLARPFSASDETPAGLSADDASGWSPGKMYTRVKARVGSQMGYYTEPVDTKLLPEVPEAQRAPFTLVLSLEDLLIHTSWDTKHGYRVAKRPGLDYFLRYLSQYYELVLFTSVPRSIADPVIAKMDPYHIIQWPLGREATKFENGEIVKDLSYLNRPLSKTLIIDTRASHVRNQPENAIVLPKWSGDPKDPHTNDLVALIPFLEYVATMGIDDVRKVLRSFDGLAIPEEFARREAEARRVFNAQLAADRARKPKFSVGSLAGALGVKSDRGMGGGMVLADGQSVAEGLAQGKMLSDQIREQGQKQYEYLEKQIRENGAQWLKDEAEELKKAQEAQMRDVKEGVGKWFGGGR